MLPARMRLCVNLNTLASVRRVRNGRHPDLGLISRYLADAGADSIALHLTDDKHHVTERDIQRLTMAGNLPLNVEVGMNDTNMSMILRAPIAVVTIVPDKSVETGEVIGQNIDRRRFNLQRYLAALHDAQIRSSIYIPPDAIQVDAARSLNADIIELNASAYVNAPNPAVRELELARLREAAVYAHGLDLEVHVGGRLTFDTIARIAAIPTISEVNIGHALIAESAYHGLSEVVQRMRTVLDQARLSPPETAPHLFGG